MENKCTKDIFQNSVKFFEMLKDDQRQEILINLANHNELNVSDLVKLSNLSTSAISHHLQLLYKSGLVTYRKEGTKKYYSIIVTDVIKYLEELLEHLKELNIK